MEQKVAETLLEKSKVIVIGGESFNMKPPSIATLVLASSYIKKLPKEELDENNLIPDMLSIADSITPVGYALSAMILGVEEFEKLEKRKWFSFFKNREKQGFILAEKINRADIREVYRSFYKVLESMNLTDFFQLTTFLIELNLTKPTKKVV